MTMAVEGADKGRIFDTAEILLEEVQLMRGQVLDLTDTQDQARKAAESLRHAKAQDETFLARWKRKLATHFVLDVPATDQGRDAAQQDAHDALHEADRERDRALNTALYGLHRHALCISGGGIRSATFALGVIQSLAAHPRKAKALPPPEQSALARMDYLSTVSGGGYIGSWLSAWLQRFTLSAVVENLRSRPLGPEVEPPQIEELRQNSNYLTPKTGLASADFWAAGALLVRNLFINWLLILSILSVGLLGLKLLLTLLSSPAVALLLSLGNNATIVGVAGLLLIALAQRYTLLNYASRDQRRGQGTFLRMDLFVATMGGLLLSLCAIYTHGWELAEFPSAGIIPVSLGTFAISGFLGWLQKFGEKPPDVQDPAKVVGFWAFIISVLRATPTPELSMSFQARRAWRALAWTFGAGLTHGLILYAGLLIADCIGYQPARMLALALLAPVWIIAAHLTSESVFVLLTNYETGSDMQREWLARSAGWFAALIVLWLAISVLGLLGSRLTDIAYASGEAMYQVIIAGAGGAGGLTAAIIGSGAKTKAKPTSKGPSWRDVLTKVGGFIFFTALLLLLSFAIDALVLGGSLLDILFADIARPDATQRALHDLIFNATAPAANTGGCELLTCPWGDGMPTHWPILTLLLALAVAALLMLLLSRLVNINRFSLHDLYRNRLIRAYLGASHYDRSPNGFTGFDTEDNIKMHRLVPEKGHRTGLYHIVNCTLNLVATRNKAWQQRKAMSFIVSPLFSGAADLRPQSDRPGRPLRYAGAYRSSREYGGVDGISLGTAMAISGAAANPNMGYNSSPSITLLFALFNVRLGWWLGNTAEAGNATYRLSGPSRSAGLWLAEAFGLTNADHPYVNLSDGGHFENLALYEMVRRRCRAIILSDAGCDPDFKFEDLGNAVRKISIDLGVTIDFPDLDKLRARIAAGAPPRPGPYCTVGRINYDAADGAGSGKGYILYIKPSYHGTEGAGIVAYANNNPAFPHDSTANQWFDETLFESYRSLGQEITDQVLAEWPGDLDLWEWLALKYEGPDTTDMVETGNTKGHGT